MSKDKVYYDENCYVCSLEINAIRRRGESCGIEFVDISSGDFSDEYDKEMIGNFAGEKTVGIETFRQMYEKMGFKKSVAFSRLPIIRQAFDCGYKIFAYGIRPYLPKRG
jgi:predicted DCC family thiol-disulfide oxidoreductase YuxK